MALGFAHRTDRGNKHYRVLTENASNFMAITAGEERAIVNEGGVWPLGDTLDLAYAEGGEMMWLQTYGRETKTSVVSPELPHDGADLLLEEGFTCEEIACYYFVRQVPQWQRTTLRPDFETYMQRKMDRKAQMLEWDFDFSLRNLIAVYEGIYNKRFDRTETRFFYQQSIGYMLPPTSRVHQAAIACNMGRDVSLWRTMKELFDQRVSVLSGFGLSHILAVKPMLEQLGTHGEARFVAAHDLGSLAMDQYVVR